MMKLRMMMGVAALGLLAACSGSGPGEEQRAAELIHGLKDKLVVKDGQNEDHVALLSTSPAKFEVTVPPTALKLAVTITKKGKCQYQSVVEHPQGTLDLDFDLTGLDPDGYPPHAPHSADSDHLRSLNGAVFTCKVAKSQGANGAAAMCREYSSITQDGKNYGHTFAFGDIQPAAFKELATKFKQDYCQ